MYRRFFIVSLCLLLAAVGVSAKVYTVKDVPNVHLKDKTQYVSDPDSLLSPGARDRTNAILGSLADSTTVETAMVVLEDIGEADIYDFALGLGRRWGVGKKDKNNGVVVVFAMKQRQIRIQTGSGAEGVLPDIAARRLIDEKVIPCMKTGDLDNAVIDLSKGLYTVFTDPKAAAELRSDQGSNDLADLANAMKFFICLATFVSICFLLYYIVKMRGLSSYQKALVCRENRWVFLLLAVISLGAGIPVLLIYLLLGYYYRNKRRKCDVCGTYMNKLSEKDDNAYLTSAQDMEEKMKSVDYDVWLCPKCGTTEIFPFVSDHSKYKVCPRCNSRTLELVYDRVEKRPTQMSDGVGVRVYQCKNCGFRTEERYSIPKLAAAVFIGGGGGMGSGGGGGVSGGSWGGGGFSGGGAGGSW